MENKKENNAWKAVPQFGGWDHKTGGNTNYSMVFSQARANRKQHKSDFNRGSLGNEEELIPKHHHHLVAGHHHQVDSPSRRKKFLSYFNCCIKA
ncbi:uncharacterized protein LOC131227579 [Magnolia sinica]|uniref:uncharacterized protein LOC131227579 n=1 Tax=Magnolia sinica TaxID=86752 RepID=UPI00265A0639|nr:uncharacterized protein LOC131227579 [Magnolia sinica]